MRRPRFFTRRVERIAERVGLAAYILTAVALVGRQYVADMAGSASVAPSAAVVAPSASVVAATPSPTPLVTTIISPATASPTAAPATASASPPPTRDPLIVTAYTNGGRRFAALNAPVGYTLAAPISGSVSVVVYQFLGGEIRVGSNIPTEPFFPYITVTSADLKLVLRPGALKDDVQLLVKDGDMIRAGAPLLTIVGRGASSWRTFYDRSLTAQILASATARPSGLELDPVQLVSR